MVVLPPVLQNLNLSAKNNKAFLRKVLEHFVQTGKQAKWRIFQMKKR